MIPRYTRPEMAEIFSEEHKWRRFLDIEILACEAWAQRGVVPAEALVEIREKANFSVERISEIEKRTNHDIIAFLECVAEYVGPSARYIHKGLTSTDIVDTALASIMVEAIDVIEQGLSGLKDVLANQAIQHRKTLAMGRTHGVHAEPMTMGLRFANWYMMVVRDLERLSRAREVIAVGKISGPVGTYSHIEPEIEKYVCEKLGLVPAPISTQILQRDRHAECLCLLAVIASTIETMATNVRLMQMTELSEMEEPFRKGQRGSSAMPHKRNPIVCERICGLARTVKGYASTGLANIPLWFERDISHSSSERVIFPDTFILLDYIIHKATGVIKDIKINTQNIERNLALSGGQFYTQGILLALTDKGLSREEAYGFVQQAAFYSRERGMPFTQALQQNEEITRYLDEREIEQVTDMDKFWRNIDLIYNRLGLHE